MSQPDNKPESKPEQKPPGTDAKPATDYELMRENEMLKAQVKLREDQLRQAITIANKANDQQKARDEAEKQHLINSIIIDGKFDKESLTDKTLSELQLIRTTLDKSIEKTFANVAAEMDEAKRKKQPLLTVGYYDTASKTWKGGLG
jgi:LPS O-antigen subunit length determinant protein (WzzB/FepE family)